VESSVRVRWLDHGPAGSCHEDFGLNEKIATEGGDMALRFFKRVKLAPGVKLNLSKSGPSVTVGPRGAGVTLGRNGATARAGIPGSGLRVVKKLDTGKK